MSAGYRVAPEWTSARKATGSNGAGAALVRQIPGPDVRGMFSGPTGPEVLAFVAEEVKSTPSYASVPLLFDHCAQDWRDVLPRVDVPTLVIGCGGSHVSPDSQCFVARRIPDARLHVFPTGVASSHFPFLENPPAFNAVVEKFLAAAQDATR
ncbi:alpha/beta fold hydrolase [Streptomyces sp. NPDC003032]